MHRQKEETMFQKILLAYDGSNDGQSALIACAEIAAFADMEAHLVAVAGLPDVAAMSEGIAVEGLLEDEKQRMREVLDEGVEQLKTKGFNVTGHMATGVIVDEICLLARHLE